jgi:hypothetical protein
MYVSTGSAESSTLQPSITHLQQSLGVLLILAQDTFQFLA